MFILSLLNVTQNFPDDDDSINLLIITSNSNFIKDCVGYNEGTFRISLVAVFYDIHEQPFVGTFGQ